MTGSAGAAAAITRLRAASAIAALFLVPAAAPAQPAKGAPPARIEFRAMSEDGQPVVDLNASDLSLKVNGKTRAIQSLTLFRAVAGAPAIGGGTPAPPPYSTNVAGAQGRVLYVLIDDDSITPGREAAVKDAARVLMAELSPADRIGVLNTIGAINLRPTTDIAKVRSAIDGFAGRAGASEVESESKCRTTRVLAAAGTMLSVMAGTPTTIVVFSSGLAVPQPKQVLIGSATAGTSDLCPVEPDDFANLGNLVGSAAADVYLFQTIDGLARHVPALDIGYESLAGATGGQLVRLQGNPQPSVARLLRETSAYYIATFTPEPGERSGQPMRVELKTTRDKLKLRTQPSLALARDLAVKVPAPRDMLRVGTEYRDLPLRASSYASRLARGSSEVKIVTLFESPDAAALAAASVGIYDEKGTLRKQWTATKEDVAKRLVRADLQAPPGIYRVRVAAVDAAGRAGTTDAELNAATVRADPLELSALVLCTQGNGGFVPRLEFTDETVAVGVLEIFGVSGNPAIAVQLDVASTVEGAALATADTEIRNGTSDDARVAIGGFGIDSLPPGDYVMRAVVSHNGKPVGKVIRTLRKAK